MIVSQSPSTSLALVGMFQPCSLVGTGRKLTFHSLDGTVQLRLISSLKTFVKFDSLESIKYLMNTLTF